jgi:hypothetical protein
MGLKTIYSTVQYFKSIWTNQPFNGPNDTNKDFHWMTEIYEVSYWLLLLQQCTVVNCV